MVWSPGPIAIGVVILGTVVFFLARQGDPGLVLVAGLTTISYIGLASAFLALLWAEWALGRARGNVHTVLGAQSLYAAAVVFGGAAVGAVGARLRAVPLFSAPEFDRAIWMAGAVVAGWACVRLATSTRRLVLEGESVASTLEASERAAHAVHIRALQLKAEPDLILRAMTSIADAAQRAPADAERAVEALAAYLRKGLKDIPDAIAPIDDEVRRTHEYFDILALAGVTIPIEWKVDDDVRAVVIPSGVLRTFVDCAVGRCQKDSGQPSIAVRAYQHSGRVYLVVTDTAAPDSPTLVESDALAALRERTGAPPKRRVRVETSVMLEVDSTATGTTQTFSMRMEVPA
jgi:hypothetical protein